jgi:N-methylhydantoinase A
LLDPADQDPSDPAKTRARRPVCFDPDEGFVDTPVHWRPDLRAGDTFTGPAIVEEFGSTTPVHPGFVVRVDTLGNLVITRSREEGDR